LVSVQTNPRSAHAPIAIRGCEATDKAQGTPQPSGNDRGKGKTGRMKKMNHHRGSVMSGHRKKMVDTVIMGKEPGSWRPWTDVGTQTYPYRTPIPRSRDGIHPSRSSTERNMITPMRSGITTSKPTARAAELLSGSRKIQEANASSRKATGMHNRLDREIPNPKGR